MSEGTKGYSDVDWVERIHRSLHAAGVFDPKRHTACDIDALAAQRDEARQEVDEMNRQVLNQGNLIVSLQRNVRDLEAELATLRQQQGKGEGDTEKLADLAKQTVWYFGDDEKLSHITETTWWGEEASRAT